MRFSQYSEKEIKTMTICYNLCLLFSQWTFTMASQCVFPAFPHFTSSTGVGRRGQFHLPQHHVARTRVKMETLPQTSKHFKLQIKPTNYYIKWVLSSSFDKWTFMMMWKAKFEVRNFRLHEFCTQVRWPTHFSPHIWLFERLKPTHVVNSTHGSSS